MRSFQDDILSQKVLIPFYQATNILKPPSVVVSPLLLYSLTSLTAKCRMACKDYDYITLKNWKNFLSGKYNEMVIQLDYSIIECIRCYKL